MINPTCWELPFKKLFKRGHESFGKKMRQLAREEYFKHPGCWIDTWRENSAEYVWSNYYSANENLSDDCYPSLKSDNVSWKAEEHLGVLKVAGNIGHHKFLFKHIFLYLPYFTCAFIMSWQFYQIFACQHLFGIKLLRRNL